MKKKFFLERSSNVNITGFVILSMILVISAISVLGLEVPCSPPEVYVDLGEPQIYDSSFPHPEWPMIGSNNKVYINASDPIYNVTCIEYSVDPGIWIHVDDNDDNDEDETIGKISVLLMFNEDCWHQIDYRAENECGVWNPIEHNNPDPAWLDIDFYVDATSPVTTYDIVGPTFPIFDSPDFYWMGRCTYKWVNTTDDGCLGGSGVDTLFIEISTNITGTWIVEKTYVIKDNELLGDDDDDDDDGVYDLDTETGQISAKFNIDSDCWHIIKHWGVDLAGNIENSSTEENKQKHKIDATPPSTYLSYEGIVCCETVDEVCITTDTNISINTVNEGISPCIYPETMTFWRIYVGAEGRWYPDEVTGEGSYSLYDEESPKSLWKDVWWYNYSIPFNLTEECEHYLEFFAKDPLCNTEETHNITHYVDNEDSPTPPILIKIVGDPNCTGCDMGEGNYCVNMSTPITVIATDEGCCPCVDVTIEYKISTDAVDGEWMIYEGPIYFSEECKHYLDVRASDCLGNMVYHPTETFYVDNTPPVIEKIVGDPNCTSPCKIGNYCVNLSTNITLKATDGGCCPCDDVTIEYKISTDAVDGEWMIYEGPIYFSEECKHYLDVRASDCLGNMVFHPTETFYVDDTPPVIEKIVGDPNCTGCDMGEGDYCVTLKTPVNLKVKDGGCCPCDDVTIEYKISTDAVDGEWMIYEGPIYFSEECKHYLDVRASDCLGNMVYHPTETFYVDETPPVIEKIVGDPNCTGCGMEPDDYCVNMSTPITLIGTDEGCCPCADVTIEYKISTGGSEGKWVIYEGPIYFSEECKHYLDVRASDCLGNMVYHPTETFYVDETPPKATPKKEVGEPSVLLHEGKDGDPYDNDIWIISSLTEICFDSEGSDVGCCPCEEVLIEYRIWYLGDWGEWTIYDDCITLTGGCVHYLEARARDCLGNYGETDNETFFVCSPGDTSPKTRIIEPLFGSTHCERTLKVKIDASDDATSKEDLIVKFWIPGGRRDAPTLWYDAEYNSTDGYYYGYVDIFKYQNGAELTIEACAIDEDMNPGFAVPVTFEVCSNTVWDQWMQKGWNSLTLPYGAIECSNLIKHVLASIDGLYDLVFYYDGTEWVSYSSIREELGLPNELELIKSGKTYWVHLNNTEDRYYSDTHGPVNVTIISPDSGETMDEPCEIVVYAYDAETGIASVEVEIHDVTDDKYWNGTIWKTGSELVLCEFDYEDIDGGSYWEYLTCDIWTMGHTYEITATGIDGAGCSDTDNVTFSLYIEEECPSGGGATVIPDYFTITMTPGETVWDNKTIVTDEIPFGKLDVLFLFDLTGSMSGILSQAKTSAIDIMGDISALIDDSAFGVGSFMDYPGFDSEDYCGYDATYGSSGDYPWNLDQDITIDASMVNAAVNDLDLGSGWDTPESYARALYESQFVSWRVGARKIVVIFEDATPHDCDWSTFGCSSGSTGVDPGRDSIAGTSDDLPWVKVIGDLKTKGISIVTVDSGSSYGDCPWIYASDETGGIFSSLGSTGTLAEEIVDLIEDVTSKISELTLLPETGYEGWFEWDPIAYYDVLGGETVEFNMTITVPEETPDGTHHICLMVVGDGSILAVQEVIITVKSEPM